MLRLHNLYDCYQNILGESDADLLRVYINQQRIKEPFQKYEDEEHDFKVRWVQDLNERVSPLRLLALVAHDKCQEMIENFYNDRVASLAGGVVSRNLCIEKDEIHIVQLESFGKTLPYPASYDHRTSRRCFVLRYIVTNPEDRKLSVYSQNTYDLDQPENSLCILPASPFFCYQDRPGKGELEYIEMFVRFADE